MANRHLSRSVVMQTLFEWDFGGQKEGVDIKESLQRNAEEFAPGLTDYSFLIELTQNILKKRPELDLIIEKAAPEWPIDKISIVDRNILRLGLYELLFSDRDEVPAKVAINEAIELAKTFGGENSGKFVNGVLGTIYKELGEPGKDSPPRVKKSTTLDKSKMPIQRLGGMVVYARDDKDGEKGSGDIYLALVHDIFGRWTLSKGRLDATAESDEDVRKGTIKKIKEEIGAMVKIKEDLGTNEYVASDPTLGKIRKQVHYFLGESKYEPLELEKDNKGLDEARWFKLSEILGLNFYNDILPIVTNAITILTKGADGASVLGAAVGKSEEAPVAKNLADEKPEKAAAVKKVRKTKAK